MPFPFDPTTRSFSLTNALGSALAAQLAYADPDDADRALRNDWGFDDVKHYASPPGTRYDTQAFLALRSDLLLVAFRGTELHNIKDWLTDADLVLTSTDLGNVHTGFWQALGSVWPAMLENIQAGGARSLWFTGHSLGAALSTLAVASCRAAGVSVAGHYNFGSPRVGDSSFTDFYNEGYADLTFRFVNNNDIVPRIPPRELTYQHVNSPKYLDSHCNLVSDMRILDLLLDSFEGSIPGLRKLCEELAHSQAQQLQLPDLFKDHLIPNYIACLKKNQ